MISDLIQVSVLRTVNMSGDCTIQAGKTYSSIDTPQDSNLEWEYVTNKNAQKRSDHTTRSIIIIIIHVHNIYMFYFCLLAILIPLFTC